MKHQFAFAAVVLTLAAPLGAQALPNRSWALSAGAMSYDASGTGTAPVIALSAMQTLPWRWLALEASAGYSPLSEQFGEPTTHLGIAELEAQAQYPGRTFRPYLGVGGGFIGYLNNADGRRRFEPSVALGGGLRAALSDAWGVRVDTRVRGWQFAGATDWAVNTSGEFTVGLTRRF